jgi:hypothetical protein
VQTTHNAAVSRVYSPVSLLTKSRTLRSIPHLSPGTAQSLVERFSHPHSPPRDTASSSSDSPDSLYSNSSPTFPDLAFEYDDSIINTGEIPVEEFDVDEYDAGLDEGYESPSWARWPETRLGSPGWTPSPKDKERGTNSPRGTPTKSIIALSPRGSPSPSLTNSRRNSATPHRLRSDLNERRESNPSLLGFELAQRRSSVRSLGSRRRSSAFLNTSVMDPVEDSRLRNIASMDTLGRRFSEVVEVTCPSDSDSEASSLGRNDTAIARARMSVWSPDSSTDNDTDSEIHTAPYFPTPPMNPIFPSVLSNYPLSSVARDVIPISTPSEFSAAPSPVIPTRLIRPSSLQLLSTPPPPAQPQAILRSKTRPGFPRAATDYTFPARSDGVPLGAGPPRPAILNRSISTPFFSAAPAAREAAHNLEKRVAGTFPMARSIPLGVSPLRASLRRGSVISDDGADSRRASHAERRSSQLREGPTRRSSADTRRSSKSGPASRQGSVGGTKQRQGSTTSMGSRGSVTSLHQNMRRPSKASLASRKSSVVSIGEYGYLGPQIFIDIAPSFNKPVKKAHESTRLIRLNAPNSIQLPSNDSIPSSGLATPHGSRTFTPLDTFLGTNSASPNPSTPGTIIAPRSPFTPGGDYEKTPILGHGNIMDRGRPISPPQFRDSFHPRSKGTTTSPRTSPQNTHQYQMLPIPAEFSSPSSSSSPSVTTPNLPQGILRKAPPSLSSEQLKREEVLDARLRDQRDLEVQRRFERRGAMGSSTSNSEGDEAILRATASHRRTISVEVDQSTSPTKRPTARRQATMPVELDQLRVKRRSQVIERLQAEIAEEVDLPGKAIKVKERQELGHGRNQSQSQSQGQDKVISKRSSVTFSEIKTQPSSQPTPSPNRPSFGRSSSFTRFFHSKSKNPSTPLAHGQPSRPSIRPASMQGGSYHGSSGADRTLGEMREKFKKISSGGSPREFQ